MIRQTTNRQGGDNNLPDGLYKIALNWINDNDRVLNLGCGQRFNFERLISSQKSVEFTSVDIQSIKPPKFVNKFIVQDVENRFLFEEKFDVVTFFELIEHIDKTDVLLKNCFNNLKKEGTLIFSFPNLASLYARIELMFGLQPHILEISNERANFGTGIFGRLNNKVNRPIHHIRGITHKAMREFVQYHGFKILHMIGYDYRIENMFRFIPSVAPVNINIFVAKKC